ncbi:hypothetical protein DFH27DRAFT_615802 [Peziza echinospora]|nr:hypothetical protein DFH27DRAFT_615802 [Peziza echinospora]
MSWEVHSHHINIGEGDCCIHLLVEVTTLVEPEPNNVEVKVHKAVLIDGGEREPGRFEIKRYVTALARSEYVGAGNGGTGRYDGKFSSIIITHWDSDHYEGVIAAMLASLEEAGAMYLDGGANRGAVEFQKACFSGEIGSPYCEYKTYKIPIHGDVRLPETFMYMPYTGTRSAGFGVIGGGLPPGWSVDTVDMGDGTTREYVAVRFKASASVQVPGRDPCTGTARVARLVAGVDMVGFDFFENTQLYPGDAKPKSPYDVSIALSAAKRERPVMFCVACDGRVCDPHGEAQRAALQWRSGRGYHGLHLADPSVPRDAAASACAAPFNRGSGHGHDASAAAIVGTTTAKNQSSIASMIIWPDDERANVSHYLGGDLGDFMEDRVLRWSTVPTDGEGKVRKPTQISHLKLSHHGAKFSTPCMLLLALRPTYIVAPNSLNGLFNHVSWEILCLLIAYKYWNGAVDGQHDLAKRNVLLCMNLPIYLCKYWAVNFDGKAYGAGSYPSPGKVASLKAGDQNSKDWREVLEAMWALIQATWPATDWEPLSVTLNRHFQGPGTDMERRVLLCEHLSNAWERVSLISKSSHATFPFQPGMELFNHRMQRVRAIVMRQTKAFTTRTRRWVLYLGLNEADRVPDVNAFLRGVFGKQGDVAAEAAHGARGDCAGSVPVNTRTKGTATSMLRLRQPAGMSMSAESARCLGGYDDGDGTDADGLGAAFGPRAHDSDDGMWEHVPPALADADGPYYFAAHDAVVPDPADIAMTHPRDREGHLDLLLGSLRTGAVVLSRKATDEMSLIPLHGSDELLQWLSSVLEAPPDGPALDLSAQASTANIAAFQLTARMGTSGLFARPFLFGTAHADHAFHAVHAGPESPTPRPDWIAARGAQPADLDAVDRVGPALMLLMGLAPSTETEAVTATLAQVLEVFKIRATPFITLFSGLVNLSLDDSAGAKNAVWFFPDSAYSTILRLCFKPAPQDDLEGKLANALMKIAGYTGVNVTVKKPRIIAKKRFLRELSPMDPYAHTVESTLVIKSIVVIQPTKPPDSLALEVETALVLEPERTLWVLTLEPSHGTLSYLIAFIASLLPFEKQSIPDPSAYLPALDNIVLRRVTYTTTGADVSASGTVQLDFEVQLGPMILTSAIIVTLKPQFDVTFHARLFPENRVKFLDATFSFLPYMPSSETWTALPIVSESGRASDVGNLNDVYQAVAKEELAPGPMQLALANLELTLSKERVIFNAMLMGTPPDRKTSKVPVLRLGSASLDLQYDITEKRLLDLAIKTEFLLTSPRASLSAKIGLSVVYSHSSWTLRGSVTGLSGALLYTLFDDDCSIELVNLLEHISLDLALQYKYEGGVGSSIAAEGALYLGALEFHYKYIHNGKRKDAPEDPDAGRSWSFEASLQINAKPTKLSAVVKSICGAELAKNLPSFLGDIDIAPHPESKSTSLRVEQKGGYFIIIVTLRVSDGTTICFYQVQKQRADLTAMVAAPTKRVLVFSLTSLPSVGPIPLVGELRQPFDELHFMWVNGDNTGLTRGEIDAIESSMVEGELPLRYRDNVKPVQEPDKPNPEDVLLASGFHFIVVEKAKVLIDYAFGGRKKEKQDGKKPPPDEKQLQLHAHGGFGMEEDEEAEEEAASTSPVKKTIGPLTLTGLGLKFNMKQRALTIIADGSVKLGPLDLALSGFSVTFTFGEQFNLKNLGAVTLGWGLHGIAAGFTQAPLTLAGMFEHGVNADKRDYYQGGATVGFVPYVFQAAGYYGENGGTDAQQAFKSFFAFCRLDGPIMTIGYADIRGLTGGFGYNSTIRFPMVDQVSEFPFIRVPETEGPADALAKLFASGWFAPRKDTYWAAAGLTVMAFQMLHVSAVVVAEFSPKIRLGIFGLATAEMPKKVERKFVRAQLGLAATLDVDAGILTVDGQLTPVSFILDPSCHLTGGFALYSWFGSRDQMQGHFVFTIGGYHAAFTPPPQYPVPPRLAVSWNFDKNINITGEAYFAITTKMCMGGGKLDITLNMGLLSAYFNAYADFLINYKPFYFTASGGITVGVHFVLDLWLVTVEINIDIGATLYLEGPPIAGRVHVDFYVFGFDVNFGNQQVGAKGKLEIDDFYDLALQADSNPPEATLSLMEKENGAPVAHLFACTSGLIVPEVAEQSAPSSTPWLVRGAIFAFQVSCKFAVGSASVKTGSLDPNLKAPEHAVDNTARDQVYANPMGLERPMYKSDLCIKITPLRTPTMLDMADELVPLNPEWDASIAICTDVPFALWGKYNPDEDPIVNPNNSASLDGTKNNTCNLMTGVQLYTPTPRLSPLTIAEFDYERDMRQIAGYAAFPEHKTAYSAWSPSPREVPETQFKNVKEAWETPRLGTNAAQEAADIWSALDVFGWEQGAVSGAIPTVLVGRIMEFFTEAPALCSSPEAESAGFEWKEDTWASEWVQVVA